MSACKTEPIKEVETKFVKEYVIIPVDDALTEPTEFPVFPSENKTGLICDEYNHTLESALQQCNIDKAAIRKDYGKKEES